MKLLIATLKKEISSTEINKYLFEKGFVLSHLVKRKPSLEQQFLDLTNNATDQSFKTLKSC